MRVAGDPPRPDTPRRLPEHHSEMPSKNSATSVWHAECSRLCEPQLAQLNFCACAGEPISSRQHSVELPPGTPPHRDVKTAVVPPIDSSHIGQRCDTSGRARHLKHSLLTSSGAERRPEVVPRSRSEQNIRRALRRSGNHLTWKEFC